MNTASLMHSTKPDVQYFTVQAKQERLQTEKERLINHLLYGQLILHFAKGIDHMNVDHMYLVL